MSYSNFYATLCYARTRHCACVENADQPGTCRKPCVIYEERGFNQVGLSKKSGISQRSNHNSSPEGPPYPTAWSKRESASPPCGYVVWCGPLLPSCTPRTSTFGQSIRSHAELPRCLAAVSDYAVSFHAAPGAALAIVWSTARKRKSPQGLTVPRRNLGSLRNDSQSLRALC